MIPKNLKIDYLICNNPGQRVSIATKPKLVNIYDGNNIKILLTTKAFYEKIKKYI
ncbi:hypothetical protein KAH94_00590 [bacterium]|nr:hypothetical protein [bacterium]